MIGLRRVLVPIDFSETSGVAFQYADELGRKFGASIDVLHVLTGPVHDNWAGYSPGASFLRVLEQTKEDARRRLEQLIPATDLGSGRVSLAAVWGDPSDEVLKYAQQHDVDLIVCGTHGRRGWNHLVMGSVAERIVRHASCPVLTVHHPDRALVTGVPVTTQAHV